MATERLGLGFDLFHHLFRAVPRRPRVPDARPDDQRPRRLEHRDLDERRRGAEHGARCRTASTTDATTAPTSSWKWCCGHWDSWEDDAIVADKQTGLFAHPEKVQRLDHQGEFFRSRGPFTVPRSAQGHPVLIQAGQSGRGRRFAARWAELRVRRLSHDRHRASADYAAFKQQIADDGTRPGEGRRLRRCLYSRCRDARRGRGQGSDDRQLPKEIDSLSLLSRSAELRSLEASRSTSRGARRRSTPGPARRACATASCASRAIRNPTPRDFMEISHRGTFHDHPRFIGSPKDVADGMEEWFATAPATATWSPPRTCPAATRSSCRYVVPELQRRGLFHKDYRGTTLRENLGLERPPIGAWREVHN